MYPLAAVMIIADSYMDDIASWAISVAERRKLITQILKFMVARGFRSYKISASNPAMVDGVPSNQVNSPRMVSIQGLKLNHDSNEFLFKMRYSRSTM